MSESSARFARLPSRLPSRCGRAARPRLAARSSWLPAASPPGTSPIAKAIIAVGIIAAGLITSGVFTAGIPVAHAQDNTAAAEALFNQGRALMQQQNFAEACEKFAASHQLDPSVGALLNLGDCREKNSQIASAWGAYAEAASMARSSGDNRRERFARERSKALESRLSYLTIEVGADVRVPGLALTRDGEPVPAAVWNQRVPIDGGSHTIQAQAPGYEPTEVRVEVEGERDEARATIPKLDQLPSQQPGTDPGETGSGGGAIGGPGLGSDVDSAGGMPLGRKLALGAGAVGAIGLVAGTVFGLQASSNWDEAKSLCPNEDFDNCETRGVELGDDAQSQATLSTVAFSVGVVGLAAGAALWFLSSTDEATGERAARFDPIVGPNQVGASVLLRF